MATRQRKARAAVGEKPFLYVQLRTFSHATEDQAKVEAALALATGFPLDDEEGRTRFRQVLKDTVASGHFNNPIHILETELTRGREVQRFWDALFAADGIAERLLDEVEHRLDDDLVLWFRIDKQRAAGGRIELSRGEDVIHVRAKLATYPKDREVALAWLKGFLSRAVVERTADAA